VRNRRHALAVGLAIAYSLALLGDVVREVEALAGGAAG